MDVADPGPPGGTVVLPPLAILAGGHNSRMRSLSGTLYKGFLPVEHMSLVTRHVVRAALSGVPAVWVLVDADDPLARRQLESLPVPPYETLCQVRYEVVEGTIEEKILHFAAGVGAGVPDRVLVVLGDTVAGVDLRELVGSTVAAGVDSSIGVAPFRLPFGRVELTPDGTRVASFVEKPRLDMMVNTGYMCLGSEALRLLSHHDLGRTLGLLSRADELGSVVSTTELSSIDSPFDLARRAAERDQPTRGHGEQPDGGNVPVSGG